LNVIPSSRRAADNKASESSRSTSSDDSPFDTSSRQGGRRYSLLNALEKGVTLKRVVAPPKTDRRRHSRSSSIMSRLAETISVRRKAIDDDDKEDSNPEDSDWE
jgi:hypothetical protein